MDITINPTRKQHEAYQFINDEITTELLFGGAAGPGKSWLICEWLMTQCLRFPMSRFLLGRNELKQLKATTLNTLFKVFRHHGLKKDVHWNYNGQAGIITFHNGSEILLMELKLNPSDPEMQDLGSLELTGAAVDEAGEISQKAYDILTTRIGRNNEFTFGGKTEKIKPVLVLASNPMKNFLYRLFYKPWKLGELSEHRAFVQAFVQDNPYLDETYIQQLRRISDRQTKQRLLYGNWEYDDDPARLIDYDSITDLFTNPPEKGEKYLTADIARLGKDKTVILLWDGFHVYGVHVYEKQTLDKTTQAIRDIAFKEKIPYSHIAVDEIGVGGGVSDNLPGTKGFIANSSPLPDGSEDIPNFANLKSQCAFKLALHVVEHRMSVNPDALTEKQKNEFIEEFEIIKDKDPDKEGKPRIQSKEEMKIELGRSPDFLDAAIIRMMFELKLPHMSSIMHIRKPTPSMAVSVSGGDKLNVRNPWQ